MRIAPQTIQVPTHTATAEAAARQIVLGEAAQSEALDAEVVLAIAGLLGVFALEHPFCAGLGAGALYALIRGRRLR